MPKNREGYSPGDNFDQGLWASYYIYQYYEYSSQGDEEKARDARDMAAAHGINGAIGWHPAGFAIVKGTESISYIFRKNIRLRPLKETTKNDQKCTLHYYIDNLDKVYQQIKGQTSNIIIKYSNTEVGIWGFRQYCLNPQMMFRKSL